MANTTGNKFGGRKKGTPNKMTKELRTIFKNIVYYELDSIEERLENLNERERIDVLLKLLPYVLPKIEKAHFSTHEPMEYDFN